MTNYKQFYNAWKQFAKPKRELLVEEERSTVIIKKMDPEHFLQLTTDPETYQSLIKNPTVKEPYKKSMAGNLSLVVSIGADGIVKVNGHEGRNRSVAAIKAGVPVSVRVLVDNANVTLNQILGFAGQMSDLVIDTRDIIEAGEKLTDTSPDDNKDDPLDIPTSKPFKGYVSPSPGARDRNNFISNYLQFVLNNQPDVQFRSIEEVSPNKITPAQFADKLNALYTVSDDNGKQYTFVYKPSVYAPDKPGMNRYVGTAKFMNLEPSPVDVYDKENFANERIYTITKK